MLLRWVYLASDAALVAACVVAPLLVQRARSPLVVAVLVAVAATQAADALVPPAGVTLSEALAKAAVVLLAWTVLLLRRQGEARARRAPDLATLLDTLPIGAAMVRATERQAVRTNRALRELLQGDLSLDSVAAEPLRMALSGTLVHHGDVEIEAPDGRRYALRVSAAPLLVDGTVRGAVATYIDAGPQRLAASQVREAQKLAGIGRITAGIAHDLNNTLTAVVGNVSIARAELPADSGVNELLAYAEQNAQRAADLCRQLLAYSVEGPMERQPIDLNGVVREAARLLHPAHPRAQFAFRLDPTVPMVEADADQLRQMVMRLVWNAAADLVDESGRITLSTGTADLAASEDPQGGALPAGLHALLEIADDGRGMTEEARLRLFEPYATGELGLAVPIATVRTHRGRIEVESSPGNGTRVRVYLPALRKKTGEPPSGEVAVSQWRGDGVALIVDDEPAVRRTAWRMFQSLGFDVWQATDGDEALTQHGASLDQVRVVLLDLTMPGRTGIETLQALRSQRADLPVVLTTGYLHHDISAYGVGDGKTGFLQKPYTQKQLREALMQLLG